MDTSIPRNQVNVLMQDASADRHMIAKMAQTWNFYESLSGSSVKDHGKAKALGEAKKAGENTPSVMNYGAFFAWYVQVLEKTVENYANGLQLVQQKIGLNDTNIEEIGKALNDPSCQYTPITQGPGSNNENLNNPNSDYNRETQHNELADNNCALLQTSIQVDSAYTQNEQNSSQEFVSLLQQVMQQSSDSIQQMESTTNKIDKAS